VATSPMKLDASVIAVGAPGNQCPYRNHPPKSFQKKRL
jgi:hypothetical protein